jgi:haloacid dehalogenase-like hydrolase
MYGVVLERPGLRRTSARSCSCAWTRRWTFDWASGSPDPGLSLDQIAYIGDDVNDIEALRAVGFSAAPADAMPSVLTAVHYICAKQGGEGAVREVADLILSAQKQND